MRGFSLIELLISLIIISIITIAFSPIVTKKTRHNKAALSKSAISTDCLKFDDKGRCLSCSSEICLLCSSQLDNLEGYYVEPDISCDYKPCPQNCSECNKAGCQKCKKGYYLNGSICSICPQNCTECESASVCNKCAKGYFLHEKTCKKRTEASCVLVGDICVTAFNAGDTSLGGLSIPNGVTKKYPIAQGAVGGNCENCCWIGNGSYITSPECDSNNGGYSGCTRTVCNWFAANTICTSHGWRLPTKTEAALFYIYSNALGNSGLQLCDRIDKLTETQSAKCRNDYKCQDSIDGCCDAYEIWVDQPIGALYYSYRLYDSTWLLHSNSSPYYARSVRCVYDL